MHVCVCVCVREMFFTIARNKMNKTHHKTSLAIVMALALALSMEHPLQAQDSPQDYVNAHNRARAAVGVGPVSWDETVAAYARNYVSQRANDCRLNHSGGRYGENLAWSSGALTAAAAVKLWVNERVNYNHNLNKCRPGKVCGHYTQVVWRSSVHIGCAKVTCNNGGTFVTCNYGPPGNFIGRTPC